MKNVVLIGGAGAPNYGDELIVKGWIDYFDSIKIDANITFYENIASNEVKLHKNDNEYTFKDDLVKVAKSFTNIGFWEQVIRGYRFIDNGGLEKYPQYDLSPMLKADIIQLHGGGYLNNYDPEKGFFIGFLASIKEKYDAKIYATGIGFGPVNPPSDDKLELIDEIFSLFNFFELRDVDNFRGLKKIAPSGSFINGIDDCYLFKINDLVDQTSRAKTLYLSFLSYNIEKIDSHYWHSLSKFSNKFDQIVFIESYPWQDDKVFSFLKEKLPTISKLKIADSLHKKIPVSIDDFVICSRFHVHYILSRAGVKGYYSKDSKYYNVKHQSILDRGSELSFTDFTDLDDASKLGSNSILRDLDSVHHQFKLNLCNKIYL